MCLKFFSVIFIVYFIPYIFFNFFNKSDET